MPRKRSAIVIVAPCCLLTAALAQTPPLRVASESFPDGVVGREYVEEVRYSGGCQSDLGPKPQFSVSAGALPPGLALSLPSTAGWVLGGTPTAAGAFRFTLKVADSCGNSASRDFSMTVHKAGNQLGVLPQFAFGGGWSSSLYFTNSGADAVAFAVNFAADDGRPLFVPAFGASSVMVNLPPLGTAFLEAPDAGPLTQGYATALLPPGVTGYGVLRASGRPEQEALAPLAAPSAAARLIWDDTRFATAAAAVNTGAADRVLDIVVRDSRGMVIGTAAVPLPARGKMAAVLRTVPGLAAMAGNRGSAEFTLGSGDIAVLGLRFNNGALASIPAAVQ